MGLLDFFKKAQGKYSLNWIISQNSWIFPENNGSSYINDGYKALPNVYSIISLITQKSSLVPFEVYKIKNKGKYQKYKSLMQLAKTTQDFANIVKYKNEAFDKVENTDIEKLLLTPNNQQSTQELFESLDGYKLLTGNAYLFGLTPGIGLNANKPKELYSIPSPMVSIIPISVFEGIKAFKFTFIKEQIESTDVAHFKFWNPIVADSSLNDNFYGQSPLQACRMLMGRYKDADITQGSMFKNQGPAGILTGENGSDLTTTQAFEIKDKFKQIYQGVSKAGEIMVTPAKLAWQQIGLSPVDLNIIEGKADMLSELCNAYHVPIGLFSAKNSTENNMIESRKMLITDAVIPLVEARKGVLNRWLQSKFGSEYLVEFDYTVFNEIQEDLHKLATTANAMYWTSPNEKRAMTSYDQHPDPLMDKLYFPSGLTLLDDLNGGLTDIDESLLNDEKYYKDFDPNQPRDDDGKWTDGQPELKEGDRKKLIVDYDPGDGPVYTNESILDYSMDRMNMPYKIYHKSADSGSVYARMLKTEKPDGGYYTLRVSDHDILSRGSRASMGGADNEIVLQRHHGILDLDEKIEDIWKWDVKDIIKK